MKKCFKCNVNINSNTDECPLCKTPLSSKEKGNDVFPIIITKYKNHYMIYKILLTLSIYLFVLFLLNFRVINLRIFVDSFIPLNCIYQSTNITARNKILI